jgi:hypothetical protein
MLSKNIEPTTDEKKQALTWARERYKGEKLEHVIATAVGCGFGLAANRTRAEMAERERDVTRKERGEALAALERRSTEPNETEETPGNWPPGFRPFKVGEWWVWHRGDTSPPQASLDHWKVQEEARLDAWRETGSPTLTLGKAHAGETPGEEMTLTSYVGDPAAASPTGDRERRGVWACRAGECQAVGDGFAHHTDPHDLTPFGQTVVAAMEAEAAHAEARHREEVERLRKQRDNATSVARELGADVADLESWPPDLTVEGDLTVTALPSLKLRAERAEAVRSETRLREALATWRDELDDCDREHTKHRYDDCYDCTIEAEEKSVLRRLRALLAEARPDRG